MQPAWLSPRPGPRPATSSEGPHRQLDQNPPREIYDRLAARIFGLPHVEERRSRVSVAGSRALWLRDEVPAGPPEAFLVEREFAHLHPPDDGSLHVCLPRALAQAAMQAGWAEPHGYADYDTEVMLYGPRDHRELEIIARLVVESHRFASGELGSGSTGAGAEPS